MTSDDGGRGGDAPPVAVLEGRMRPGAWDPEGFLGATESLSERLAADARECVRLGVDPSVLGARLLDVIAAGAGSDAGRPMAVGDLAVEVVRGRGFVTCPWAPGETERCPAGPGGRATANRFRLSRGDLALSGFEIAAHLVAAHGFFGGAGTRFRIEPAAAAALLGPRPGAS